MIAVKLPFSDEMREEPLANIKHILAAAKEVGLVLETNGGFDGYLPGAVGLPFYKKLTDNDKTYIGLHSYVVLRKKMSRG
jgi:hypothetical protein